MTEPTVTQADIDAAAAYWGNDNPPLELRAAFARHRTASAPAGEVDPVWIEYTSPDGDQVAVVRPGNNDSEFPYWDQRPLYAHPPAPADLVEAAAYYIDRLEAVQRREVVRDLAEAQGAYMSALAKHGGA